MSHSHPRNFNNRFLFGIILNAIFITVEILYGVKANSVALIADAAHNAGDVFGLILAWFGYWLAHKNAPERFTYGFKNATIVVAFINAILLFIAVGGISWEAFGRLEQEEAIVNPSIIIFVACVGIIINGLTAYLFFHNRHSDVNIKAAFLHMLLDAVVSAGVIVAGILIFLTAWVWIDPVISLVIASVISVSSWRLFRESLDLMLLAIPTSVNFEELKKLMQQHDGLIDYHDLHIWPLSTTEVALSAHLIVKQDCFNIDFSKKLEEKIKNNFPISHVTLQLELQDAMGHCKTNCL